jgi:hypothetical protein
MIQMYSPFSLDAIVFSPLLSRFRNYAQYVLLLNCMVSIVPTTSQIPEQIIDESNDDSSPIEVKSSLNGAPISQVSSLCFPSILITHAINDAQKRLRNNKKRSLQTHDYKMLDPADKTGHRDSYPAKGYAGEGESGKGADIGLPETV